MLRRIGTRSRAKKYRFKSSGSMKRGMSDITNKVPDKEEQLSTLFFDEYWRGLWEKVPSERIFGCVYYDPLCFQSYIKNRSTSNLKKWVSKENVFSSRYIFVPMCQSNHWNLLIICNIGEDLESETKSPCILLLDSLQIAAAQQLEPLLRRFVFDIYQYGSREESVEQIFSIPYKMPKIPQQVDGVRCGYYVLYFMFKFLMGCPDHFDISKDYPGFMTNEWFSVDDLESFCGKLTSVNKEELVSDEKSGDTKADDVGGSIEIIKHLNDQREGKGRTNDASVQADVLVISNDGLRALEIYTPESSQEQQKTIPCNKAACLTVDNALNSERDGRTTQRTLKIKIRPTTQQISPRLVSDMEDPEDCAKNDGNDLLVIESEKEDEETGSDLDINVVDMVVHEETATKSKKRKRKSSNLVKKNKLKKLKEKIEEQNEDDVDEEVEKEEEHEEVDEERPKKILTRAYPSTFSKAVIRLSEAQKKWVTDAGFCPLLSFTLGEALPHTTIVNCLWWFDQKKCELVLFPNRSIKITEDDVFDILGLPKGKLDISLGDSKEKIQDWGKQFGVRLPSRITEKMLRDKMAESSDADEHFKQNFMVLMANLFIRTDKTSFVCPKILKFNGDFENAKEYNWCKLLIEGLKEAHEQWWIDPKTQYYTGSYVFLLYFYLARTSHPDVKVKNTWPAFIGWKNSCIDDRTKREVLDNSFGQGEIVGKLALIDQSQQDDLNVEHDKQFDDGDNLKTPKETIKGVQLTPIVSQEDQINSGIMSIARDINYMYDINDIITEEAMMSQVHNDIKELEGAYKRCKNNLMMAIDLFPDHPKLKEYKVTFANINQQSDTAEMEQERKAAKDEEYILGRPRRELKVGEFHKSPYLNRTVDFDKQKLTKTEEEVWNWINGDASNPMQHVFFWEDIICMKHQLQTLRWDEQISTAVVDVYASILNEDEKYRSPDSPRRFFCSTFTTMSALTKTKHVQTETPDDATVKFRRFRSRLNIWLAKHNSKIDDIDLIFFPIHDAKLIQDTKHIQDTNHFYVVCFNIRNPSIEILDNSKFGDDSTTIYDGLPESLVLLFL